jgi:hypothetical protein
MDTLRNVSNQSLILQKPGGGIVHLLPNRAITLSAEELRAPQVLNMVKNGLAEIERLDAPPLPAPPPSERRRASEQSPPKALGPK